MQGDPRCDYGDCQALSTWSAQPVHFPTRLYACDQHAPLMFEAWTAHRYGWAPTLPEEVERAFVTACAWASVLASDGRYSYKGSKQAAFSNALRNFIEHHPTSNEARRARSLGMR